MKGLLLKDAYQAWYYAKMVVVAAVVMMGVGVISMMNGANFFIVYAGFLLGMMPMTLLAYDQTSNSTNTVPHFRPQKSSWWGVNTSLVCAGWCWQRLLLPRRLAWHSCTG